MMLKSRDLSNTGHPLVLPGFFPFKCSLILETFEIPNGGKQFNVTNELPFSEASYCYKYNMFNRYRSQNSGETQKTLYFVVYKCNYMSTGLLLSNTSYGIKCACYTYLTKYRVDRTQSPV